MSSPAELLEGQRAGRRLEEAEIRELVRGAADGSWGDAELGAFLMAAALRGLDPAETRALTLAMLESGERWNLGGEVAHVVDKHSTGGVGDKVSLLLAPLLGACGLPVAMLTGRALGHTGGTADKLESIPGLSLHLDRQRCLALLRDTRIAIGIATSDIAPADRRLYALRHRTSTIDSLPLITASILSKKLATGAAGVVFDVKVGNGAFLSGLDQARELARLLVATCSGLGLPASALLTDMNQPLGRWVGHTAEVRETLEALAGKGPEDLVELTLAIAEEAARLVGASVTRRDLERALATGEARERFDLWAAAQGADRAWLRAPRLDLAPEKTVLRASRSGVLAAVDCRRLGRQLGEAAGLGSRALDYGVALHYTARLGQRLAAGEEIARLYLRQREPAVVEDIRRCFTLADSGESPRLIRDVVRTQRATGD